MPVYCLALHLRKMRCSCQQRPHRWLAENMHLSGVLYLEHRAPCVQTDLLLPCSRPCWLSGLWCSSKDLGAFIDFPSAPVCGGQWKFCLFADPPNLCTGVLLVTDFVRPSLCFGICPSLHRLCLFLCILCPLS